MLACHSRLFLGNHTVTEVIYHDLKRPKGLLAFLSDSSFFSYLMSKFMGYLIIVGSAIMKVPQILQIIKRRNVIGLNLSSLYFECAENIPIVIYNMIHVQLTDHRNVLEIPIFNIWRECADHVAGDLHHSVVSLVMNKIVVYSLICCRFTDDPKVTKMVCVRNFSLLLIFAFGICFFPKSVFFKSFLLL